MFFLLAVSSGVFSKMLLLQVLNDCVLCFFLSLSLIVYFCCILPITIYPSYMFFYIRWPLPLLQSPHGCLCPWVLFIFAQSLYPLEPPPTRSVRLLSANESVSIFLVSSVWSVDSTCEWNYMVFVCLWTGLLHLA